MNKAVELAQSDISDIDAIHQLGEGWVAEETLAIAVFSALKYDNDFDKAIRCSVNHSGDSDSTGAVTGNILGAYLGYEAVPQKYKDNLELIDVILAIADDLYNDCQASETVCIFSNAFIYYRAAEHLFSKVFNVDLSMDLSMAGFRSSKRDTCRMSCSRSTLLI
ncbi:MAG: ADP-ribosylglycohydrolase family protein [Clostridiales bacterium]|nr:ADP-ribosylglycohydrolase family protein [Clostridiales bacterium]